MVCSTVIGLIIAERFQFHHRNQAVGEIVAEYEAELCKLATHCVFGDYLSEVIHYRIVCELCSESRIQLKITKNNRKCSRDGSC